MRMSRMVGVLVAAFLAGCSSLPNPAPGLFSGRTEIAPVDALAGLVPLPERYLTSAEEGAALSAVAVWAGGSTPWLIGIAPEAGVLQVRDAGSGQLLRTVGEAGGAPGVTFQAPHRLAVVGNLLLVVERDAPGVQVLSLPEFTPLTRFGNDGELALVRPQGVWAQPMSGWGYHVYVADDYQDVSGEAVGNASLQRRIKQFALSDSAVGWTARGIRTFGEREGEGRLLSVDAMVGDAALDRLLIADTDVSVARRLKAYALNGRFAGRTAGGGVFRSAVGGLAALQCADGSGYWVAADAGPNGDYLHLFDRQTLDYRASFAPLAARQFSALALSPPLRGHPQGMLYAVQSDGRVAAFDLGAALVAAGLKGCAG